MALGDPYITLAEIKVYLKLTDTDEYNDLLTQAISSASREIELHTGRQFNKTDTATARRFPARNCYQAEVDDFYTTTGLVVEVDGAGDGTYSTVVSSSGYELDPPDGIMDGQIGWPFEGIDLVNGQRFPMSGTRKNPLRVTAKWGWTSVPDPIKQACYIIAAENYSLKGAALGVAGFGEFGVVRVRDNRVAAAKLARYERDRVQVG